MKFWVVCLDHRPEYIFYYKTLLEFWKPLKVVQQLIEFAKKLLKSHIPYSSYTSLDNSEYYEYKMKW